MPFSLLGQTLLAATIARRMSLSTTSMHMHSLWLSASPLKSANTSSSPRRMARASCKVCGGPSPSTARSRSCTLARTLLLTAWTSNSWPMNSARRTPPLRFTFARVRMRPTSASPVLSPLAVQTTSSRTNLTLHWGLLYMGRLLCLHI